MQKPNGYWTKERCAAEALKYKTRSRFKEGSPSAYSKSVKYGWIDMVCSHMTPLMRPHGYWTKERCAKEALKYTTISDFENKSSGAYDKVRRSGWVKELCSHMIPGKKPNGYWTKERCAEEALKYTMRKDFQKGSSGCYTIAHRNGWLDEICDHMMIVGHRYERYVYEFKDPLRKVVYVGLTYHPERRLSSHKYNSEYIKKHFCDGEFMHMHLVTEKLPIEEAARIEDELINKYRNEGYHVINSHRGGGLGANHKMWTKETCAKEALKYNNRSDFSKNSAGAYTVAWREGWLDEICSHIQDKIVKRGHWTKENCQIIALKYSNQTEFKKNDSACFSSAQKKGWIKEICAHMNVRPKLPNGYWNSKENCRNEAAKYGSRTEFAKGCSPAYDAARRNGWLDEFFPK